MKNQKNIEKRYLKMGYIIERVEKKIALEYITNFLKKNLLKILKKKKKNINSFSFNNLHNFITIQDLNEVRLTLFKEMNSEKKFRDNFFKLAKNTLYSTVGNELAMQNNINLSIQMPNDDSSLLPLHSDTWDGDSPFETVLWLTLVNCFKTKSVVRLGAGGPQTAN